MTYKEAHHRLSTELHQFRGLRIWTTDGRRLTSQGSKVQLDVTGVSLFDAKEGQVEIPASQITRIEARDFGRFSASLLHSSVQLTKESTGEWGLIVPAWALAAVLAPPHIFADGLALLLHKRHYQVVH